MSKLTLESVEWGEFRIKDLFEIETVKGKPIENYKKGDIPYVSTAATNNAVINFIEKDKNILKAIIDYIESENIEVLPQNYLMDEYIAGNETYTKVLPSKNEEKTIEIGIEAARMLTDIDAGQTVVVKDESVIALEGVEGTDKAILRGGELAGKNCIVVKMARHHQDYRIDIPTIGLETIKKVVEINGRGIIIEADKMLFIDKEEVIKFANKNKIFIKGIKI